MSRLWQMVSRCPPLVAPVELRGQPGVEFGFTTEAEAAGWTVTAYGPDGRRLGRQLKGLSDPAQATLIRPAGEARSPADLQRLAEAWVRACKRGLTNADVLIAFADAANPITGGERAGDSEPPAGAGLRPSE